MREIKFRAWDKKQARFQFGCCNLCLTLDGHLLWQFGCQSPDWLSEEDSSNYILQQFTGLKDKNGKEIYESDILEAPGGRYVVEWQNAAFIRRTIFINTQAGRKQPIDPVHTLYETEGIETAEAIGNCWEHPELLKAPTGG